MPELSPPAVAATSPSAAEEFAAATRAHVAGEVAAAMAIYARLLPAEPRNATLLRLIGAGHAQLGEPAKALPLLQAALEIDPDDAETHYALGSVHANQGRLAEAIRSFQAATRLKPAHVDAARHLCRAVGELAGRDATAAADGLPTPATARVVLAAALSAARRCDEALEVFAEAARLEAGRADVHHGAGWALADLGRLDEAEVEFRTAIDLAPDLIEAYVNLANVLREGRRFDEAETTLRTALRRRPGDRRARLNLGLLLLLRGRLGAGWPLYESRWSAVAARFQPQPGLPFWRGDSDLAGKRILLFAEQGLGDTLQFVRYAPLVGVHAAEVYVEVPDALTGLLAGLPGVTAVVGREAPRPAMDLRAPLLSLPLAFRTEAATIPAEIPYVAAPAASVAAWGAELAAVDGLRVGLAWSGNPNYSDDRKRSLPLRLLTPLLDLPGIRCIVIQRDIRPDDRAVLDANPACIDLSARLAGFADTAAIVSHLDLVISADTSIAHLAGALGRPVWVMLPQVPDWRWLLDRDDSPWYPTARLFRQTQRGDWAGVVERLRRALLELRQRPAPATPTAAPTMPQALALHRQGDLVGAKALYRSILAADADAVEARHMLGVALAQQGQHAQALPHLQRALAVAAPTPGLLANLGNVLDGLGRHDESLRTFERALAIDPDAVDALNGRGIALQALDRLDEALASFTRAFALRPDFAEALHNRGTVLRELNRCQEALECCREAQRLRPGYLDAGYGEAIVRLLLGDFAGGLPLYELRPSRRRPVATLRAEAVEWRGDGEIGGRSILLYGEQGYGDSIQFCRYAALLAARGAQVIVQVAKPLAALLAGLDPALQVVDEEQPLPPFELQCPLPSLPLACATRLATIPAATPYLHADPGRAASWRQRLGGGTGLRVGLAWAGSSAHRNDRRRSLAPAALAPLLQLPCDFVCLHRELRDADREFVARTPRLRQFADELGDFADTAALIAGLDLVISVDTAVAHLAGALGKPLWILLPFAADWRWLLDRDDSPWYPGARLFRQASPGDWDEVLGRVAAALAARVGGAGSGAADRQAAGDLFDEANSLWAAGSHDAALAAYERLVALLPDRAVVHDNRGVMLRELGRDAAAIASFERAVAVDPGNADALTHLGIALLGAGREPESLPILERALAQRPADADLLGCRGAALFAANRRAEAVDSYRAALRARPDDARLHADLGVCLLGLGDFAQGWPEYEWRLACPAVIAAAAGDCPQWRGGGEIAGRTILVRAEQGLGDTLQFSRYLPLLAARGARVLLLAAPALLPLLAGIAGVEVLPLPGDELPPADLQCPLLSLPLAFATELATIPPPLPGLRVDAARRAAWAARLGPATGLRIGLAWSGNPEHRNDRRRSLPLAALDPLLALPADFVCLQREIRDGDRELLRSRPQLRDASGEIGDFADTAALVGLVDLVICVDSAVAHLAATRGRPVWLMLPFAPDWRWLLDRDDSPWYPGVRLFRQPRPGDWAAVIARLTQALAERLAAAGAGQPPGAALPAAGGATLAEALQRHQRGDFDAAERLYLQRLAAQPRDFDAIHLLATLRAQQGRQAEALAGFAAALELCPDSAPAWLNQGNALQALGRHADAVASFDRSLAIRPGHADAWFNRGNALRALGRLDAALASHERALAIRPDHPQALYQRAVVLQATGRHEAALAAYDAAFAVAAPGAAGHYNRGCVLLELRRFDAALADFDAALALAPDDARVANNRGLALLGLGRWQAAVASYERALAIDPGFAGALNNRGSALLAGQRYAEAGESYRAATAIDPEFALAQFNAGMLSLLQGDLAGGWARHEWRWRAAGGPPPRGLAEPQWLGDFDLAGRRILLHAEQGLGDTLQFARYVPQVRALGATVLLEVQPPLRALFAGFAGADAVFARGEALPPFDCQTPLLSLPLAFATRLDSIPAAVPYLQAPPDRLPRWRQLLPAGDRPRVALAWSGNRRHSNDANRSLPLATLLPLLAIDGIDFVVMQIEIAAADRTLLDATPQLLDLSPQLDDFADTAAALGCVDLLIAVDTAVAHLAGAMGLPAWVVLPAVPDWRWLLARSDSPWYPSLRLFRQPQPGDWAAVVETLVAALAEWRQGLAATAVP